MALVVFHLVSFTSVCVCRTHVCAGDKSGPQLIEHENGYVTDLSNPLNVRRRLKRQWPSYLKDQREEEE
jgi:hypothetical protein